MRPVYSCTTFIAFSVLLGGCAQVTVRKVPTPTQYTHWTDDMQTKADQMEGFRFYLPRPFVNVFESFPIRTDIYIADGIVSPDGKYVIVTSVRAESGLNDYLAGIQKDTKIPDAAIRRPTAADIKAAQDMVAPQSEAIKEAAAAVAKEAAKSQGTTVKTGGTDTGKPSQPSGTAPVTGINRRDVRNDNGAFAYQPMRGNMDVVYLPDFEEQYVVGSQAGLGNAQFQLNLGQGWSMQGFNSLTDNSELNKRIFDVIDESIRLAKAAVGTALGIPPIATAAVDQLIAPQNVSPSAIGDKVPGTAVSLKIVVVHYAAKGVYPVIKPRELQERISEQGRRYVFLDLFQLLPLPTPGSAMDPTAIQKAQTAIENESGRFTVPRYPYQYISFNTFRYMAIELITPGAHPFEYLYDKTGTSGDAGDRQKADLGGSIVGKSTSVKLTKLAANDWMKALQDDPIEGIDGFKIKNAEFDTETSVLTATVEGTDPSKTTEIEKLKLHVKTHAQKEAGNRSDIPSGIDFSVQVIADTTTTAGRISGYKPPAGGPAPGPAPAPGNGAAAPAQTLKEQIQARAKEFVLPGDGPKFKVTDAIYDPENHVVKVELKGAPGANPQSPKPTLSRLKAAIQESLTSLDEQIKVDISETSRASINEFLTPEQ